MTYITPWSDGVKPAGANIDIKASTMQHTLLQAIAATVQKLTLEQKAAMDEATYTFIFKSGNNYVLLLPSDEHNDSSVDTTIWSPPETVLEDATEISIWGINAAGAKVLLYLQSLDFSVDNTNYIESQLKAGAGGGGPSLQQLIVTGASEHIYTLPASGAYKTYKIYKSAGNLKIDADTVNVLSEADANTSFSYKLSANGDGNTTVFQNYFRPYINPLTGTIKSASIIKNANIGLRYWEELVANLVAGTAGSTIKMKILDSTGAALHTNFVTIAPAEYARIPLLRPIVLTATSGSQTVWNLTSLSNADAFINELGVLANVILVELAKDGTNYTVLAKTTDFTEDITNPMAPKITLVSGTGVISGTSKLRVSYIVNIALSNTTIKLQIQLNRVDGGDTSPSITPLPGDASNYVMGGQVAII